MRILPGQESPITASTKRIRELERELTALVESYTPQLLRERGCGPLTAARLIGEIAGADRFRTDAKLARTGGSAPIPASSGNTQRHRLNRGGNRQLNCARTQQSRLGSGHRRLPRGRQQAEGKSRKEALRCVKRHLTRRVWRRLRTPTTTTRSPLVLPAPATPKALDTIVGDALYFIPCAR